MKLENFVDDTAAAFLCGDGKSLIQKQQLLNHK